MKLIHKVIYEISEHHVFNCFFLNKVTDDSNYYFRRNIGCHQMVCNTVYERA